MTTIYTTILAVDDDATSLLVLSRYLEQFGFIVVTAAGGYEALNYAGEKKFDLVISDLRMPDMDGITLLEEMRRRNIDTPFIVVTACGSIESAVTAIRQGAFDYLEKPYNIDCLQMTVQRALNYHQAIAENRQIKEFLQGHFTFQNIITSCPAMMETLGMAVRVTDSPRTTVAVYGESGTGKEVLARAIHFASKGLPGNFVAVNCAAIPEALIESELFGHVRGAFTGADKERAGKFSLAKGGTLFLDEIGDMPLQLQAKLLRVLEEKTYTRVGSNSELPTDFRVIVATHRNLAEMVRQGTFREDLYHRINVIPLLVPPLRDRIEDIPLLTDHFLKQFRRHLGKSLPGITKNAIKTLCSYGWPGNVRELRNVLEYAAIMVDNELIHSEHLRITKKTGEKSAVPPPEPGIHFRITLSETSSLEAITDQVLQETLRFCGGNKSRAAGMLKVDRKRFYR